MAQRKRPSKPRFKPPPSQAQFSGIASELRKGKKRTNGVKIWETWLRLSETHMDAELEDARRNTVFYVGDQMSKESCASDEEFDAVRKMLAGGDYITVNRILSALAAQNSAILWRNPWHRLRARRFFGNDERIELGRHVTEHTLNFGLQHPKNNWLLNARLMVIGAELSKGIMTAVYAPHEGEDPLAGRTEELGEVEIIDLPDGTQTIAFMAGAPKLGKDKQPIMRGRKYVVENRNVGDFWRSEWRSIFAMRFDPEGGNNFERHARVAERVVWKWSSFKKNPLFDGVRKDVQQVARFLDEEGLSAHTRGFLKLGDPPAGSSEAYSPQPQDEDLMRVWGWKCWDADRREITYLVDGFEKEAAVVKYPNYIDVNPYTVCKIHENPGVFRPITEVSQVRGLSRAYNFVDTLHFRHAQRAGRVILAKEGMFDPRNQARISDKDDMRVVFYKRSFNRSDIEAMQDPILDPTTFALAQRLRSDFDEVMGSSAQSRSLSDSDTATEAAIVERRTGSRENDKRIIFKEALENHAKKYMDMMQATLDDPMLVQINGPDGVLFNRAVGSAEIQGDFRVDIELDELEPHDSRTEKAEMREIVADLGFGAFASKTFSRRFWRGHRSFDEQLVEEFHQIGQQFLEAQMAPAQDGGNKVDGTGPDEGRTTDARSQGRQIRQEALRGNGGGR